MHTFGCIWLSEARLAPARQAALLRACSSGDEFLSMSARQAGGLCGGADGQRDHAVSKQIPAPG